MGCAYNRPASCNEEIAIIQGEKQLLYHEHKLIHLYRSFSAFSNSITTDRLIEISKLHKLGMTKDPINKRIFRFYEGFKTNNYYDYKFLMLSAILLCKASTKKKALVLFEVFDEINVCIFYKEDFEAILDQIFDMVLYLLPILAEPGNRNSVYTDESFKEYLTKGFLGRVKAKIKLTQGLFQGCLCVSRLRFSEFFCEGNNYTWLSSAGVRANLGKYGKLAMNNIQQSLKISLKEELDSLRSTATDKSQEKKEVDRESI